MRCYHGKDAWGTKMPDVLMRGHHTMGRMPVGTNSFHATMVNPWERPASQMPVPEGTMEGKLPVNSDEPLMSCQPIRWGALEALDGPR